jgi:hypothetical protein
LVKAKRAGSVFTDLFRLARSFLFQLEVEMAEDIKLGEIITGRAERDAVHIAVIPLVASDDRLYAGQKVKLAFGSLELALSAAYNEDEAIGIVDPFLRRNYGEVKKGEQFWCFLFPGSVTGMRHHWQHPAFVNVPTASNEHEQWIRRWAEEWNFNYDELIEAAITPGKFEDYGRVVVARGIDLHSVDELNGDDVLFWEHLEAMTGETYSQSHRDGLGWSCSC